MNRFSLALVLVVTLVASAAKAFVWPSRVGLWQRQLASDDVALRRACMREIRELYAPSSDPLILRGLEDADGAVRSIAAETVALYRLPMAKAAVPWLGSDEAESRLLAARLFATVIELSAVEGLVRAVADDDVRIRKAACEALARYSGEASTTALIAALSDPDAQVRRMAVVGLARRDEPRVRSAIIAHSADPDAQVRASSLLALGVYATGTLADTLRPGLDDGDVRVREVAAEALGNLPQDALDVDIVSSLLRLVADAQPLSVVLPATQTLLGASTERRTEGIFGQWRQLTRGAHIRSVADLIGRTPIHADGVLALCLRRPLNSDPSSCLALLGPATRQIRQLVTAVDEGRLERLQVLRALKAVPASDALDWILTAFDTDDATTIEAASQTLRVSIGPSGLGRAFEPLVQALGRLPPASTVRREILLTIGATRASKAWALLEPALASENTSTPLLLGALEAARGIQHPKRGPRLVELLGHADAAVRWTAARQLFESTDANVLPALMRRLRSGTPWREPMVLAMSGLTVTATDPQVLDQIVGLLGDVYAPERDALLEGLARNRHPRLLASKQELVSSGSEADRAKLAESFADGDEERAWLRGLVTDRSSRVRANALWSLGRIGQASDERILVAASRAGENEERANALVALGRIARRSQRDLRHWVCPHRADRLPSIREAALNSLRVAAQRCTDGLDWRLLIDDSHARVRRAAARLLTDVSPLQGKVDDQRALRWCTAFEQDNVVRQSCRVGSATSGSTQAERIQQRARSDQQVRGSALVFVERNGMTGTAYIELPVGLERSDGLVRYARTDRRGALFEPDTLASATRLVQTIALER